MRFTGTVQDGKVVYHNTGDLKKFLAKVDGDVYVDIKVAKTRNSAQNNYYWKIVRLVGNECGYNPDEMHEIFKRKFKVESTSKLTSGEMHEFTERITRWVIADLGITLPPAP